MTKNNGKLQTLQQSAAAKRVNLAEWRASRIHDLTLPSGLSVRVRDVTMTDLMFTGRLPDSIVGMAQEAAEKGEGEFDLANLMKNTQQFNAMLDTLIGLCLVEPQIGDVADAEHITLEELPADDKMAIFAFVNRGAEQLRPFRDGENPSVETV